MVARRLWTTWCCSAGVITAWSMKKGWQLVITEVGEIVAIHPCLIEAVPP